MVVPGMVNCYFRKRGTSKWKRKLCPPLVKNVAQKRNEEGDMWLWFISQANTPEMPEHHP